MTAPRFHLSGFPRAIGFAVILHLLAVLWMSAAPATHAAAHPDASEPEHACCVTMFEAGNFHAPTTHADFAAQSDMQFVERVEPFIERIAAVRFSLGVLEHAPPATV
jgi:hypothetical protein